MNRITRLRGTTSHVIIRAWTTSTLRSIRRTGEQLRQSSYRLTEADDSPYVLIPRQRLEIIKTAKTAGVWKDNGQIVNNLRRVWLKIVKASGIPRITLHDLRRAAITNWAQCLPMHVVKELAGHVDYKTTELYYLKITEGDKVGACWPSRLSFPVWIRQSDPE